MRTRQLIKAAKLITKEYKSKEDILLYISARNEKPDNEEFWKVREKEYYMKQYGWIETITNEG